MITKCSRKKKIKRFFTVFFICIALLSYNMTALFAVEAEIDFIDAVNSYQFLNSGKPFSLSGHRLEDLFLGLHDDVSGRYSGSSPYTFSFFAPNSYSNGKYSFRAWNKLAQDLYLIPGFTYSCSFVVSSQFFDGNDTAIRPLSDTCVSFGYRSSPNASPGEVSFLEWMPLKISPSGTDGFLVRFSFVVSDVKPGYAPFDNFVSGVSAAGCYKYNYLILDFGQLFYGEPISYGFGYWIKDFKFNINDHTAYDAFMTENTSQQVSDGVVDGLHEYDKTMPTPDYSAGQDALNDYSQKNEQIENMIDSGAVNDSFKIDMSALRTGISSAGSFINFLYDEIPWFNLVIPVAVCFSALALLLGLVKNR